METSATGIDFGESILRDFGPVVLYLGLSGAQTPAVLSLWILTRNVARFGQDNTCRRQPEEDSWVSLRFDVPYLLLEWCWHGKRVNTVYASSYFKTLN